MIEKLGKLNFKRQLSLWPVEAEEPANDRSPASFVSNMKLPVHRWFRYSAGFSGQWVEQILRQASDSITVLDPFAGSGTTLIAAEKSNVASVGLESHPLVYRIARAKLCYREDAEAFKRASSEMLKAAKRLKPNTKEYPPLIHKCYSPEQLALLDTLKQAWLLRADDSPETQLLWLSLVAILRKVSHAGTAPWQYVLPSRNKKGALDAYAAFQGTASQFYQDMIELESVLGPRALVIQDDARYCTHVKDSSVDFVITSPPYANNYDYADATRLELCFLGEIAGWSDLQKHVRDHLVRACSQHVTADSINLDEILQNKILAPIRPALTRACKELADVRLTKGGKKNYHLMAACYFLDLAKVWLALRRVCRTPSRVAFVIGDSAPYGVYLDVVGWFTELAGSAGFKSARFEKFRDRNIKWKNRKHRVPLCEGVLWLEG